MKTAVSVNLASVPFRKDRPILVGSLAVGLLMVGVLVMMLYLIWIEKDEGKETAATIAKVRSELNKRSAEEARLEEFMRRPENAAVLEKSVLVNLLLRRKGISWTMIFRDLEQVLPYNVKVTQVRPQVNMSEQNPGQHDIMLDMTVASQTAEPIIDLIKALESSSLFGETNVASTLPPTETSALLPVQSECKICARTLTFNS